MAHDHEFQQLERLVRKMHDSADELNRSAREQATELARWREQMAESDDERAQRARRGDMGPDWVRLQQRIDLGQTSIADILSGQDDSRAAERVREQSLTGADALRQQLEDADREDDEPIVAEVRDQVQHIRDLLRELREMPPPQF